MLERPAAIWFEVEHFLRYFDHYASPTGIERVSFEIFGAAHQCSGGDGEVKFCRLSMFTGRFERVSFEQISSAYTSRPEEIKTYRDLRVYVVWRTRPRPAAPEPS